MLETVAKTDIIYPSSDGEPVAETYIHLYAILTTLEVLKQYLVGQKATVLANQFMYYSQGLPRMRVAPDVMIIFNVEPGGRDNYKIWEEKEVPQVIFEMTSPGTKNQDQEFKKTLYEQLGVKEYWLFDPKGEWIPEQLKGYRLRNNIYEIIEDNRSEPLKLILKVEGQLIGFYREDTGEKLLIPEELATALQEKETELQQKETELQQERKKVSEMEAMIEKYRQKFGDLSEQ
ncbi:Uma2 family endonuclease [Crocosphaera sp.]|uniref:Uma2 family endonuclease n=1 Tax=Crocosphaera sp. TaxID=2729996 RepID=UPI0026051933|nr:Uma2 family endonuclease [Crocosphaera sp.]MDJ0580707.1 Uma2 family endonuclease [Crocosphaera sp.]